MEDKKIERIWLEDGRTGEKHTTDNGVERVEEIYVEPTREKNLSRRMIERRRPCVYQREIETLNENNEVIDRKVESIDPEAKMELREHIALNDTVSAQSVEAQFVTAADLERATAELGNQMLAAVKHLTENLGGQAHACSHKEEKVSAQSVGSSVSNLQLQISDKVQELAQTSKIQIAYVIIIAGLAAYILRTWLF